MGAATVVAAWPGPQHRAAGDSRCSPRGCPAGNVSSLSSRWRPPLPAGTPGHPQVRWAIRDGRFGLLFRRGGGDIPPLRPGLPALACGSCGRGSGRGVGRV